MSQLADIQEMTQRWKRQYNWSEDEHVANYREILQCLEWESQYGDYPMNDEGRIDWEEVERLDDIAARKSLGYSNGN